MKTSIEDLSVFVAGELLRIGAVSLSPADPFTWVSGLLSPIYCDNRLSLAYPGIRSGIADGFVDLIAHYEMPCDVVGGIATAGIPHAAWVADRLGAPMIYVRGEAKSHGRKRQIEGELAEGSRVVLIEDLVSTGRSSVAVVEPIRSAGCTVSCVMAIFSYGLDKARQAFDTAGIPLFTLTNFETLIDVARRDELISEADLNSLQQWHRNPVEWSDQAGL